jgi:adenylate cyclase
VWIDTRVTVASIKDYVACLRRVLGDAVDAPTYIETVRGLGYRFVGDIEIVGQDPDEAVIAVLPFEHPELERDMAHLAVGITEDVISGLSRFRDLVVVSRHSSFSASARSPDITETARRLRARWIVTGSVRTIAGRVRLGVQMREGRTGRTPWAETYDRPVEDGPGLSDDVVSALVVMLVGSVQRADTERALAKSGDSLTAYDLVLHGRHRLAGMGRDGVLEARAILTEASRKHPSYVPALVWLAETYYVEATSVWTSDGASAAARALELGEQAVRSDPLDSMAHLVVGWGLFRCEGDLVRARAALDRALALNPNDYYSLCLDAGLALFDDDLDRALESGNRALRRSPLVPDGCAVALGFAHYFREEYAQALRGFALKSRPSIETLAGMALCYRRMGQHESAERAMGSLHAELSKLDCEGRREGVAERSAWASRLPFRRAERLDELMDLLRSAGL